MDIHLSNYGRASCEPAPVNRMMASFASDFRDGVDINLGVGYVNEQTIPQAHLLEAMQALLADPLKYRQAFNYGGPEGSAHLIAAIRHFLIRSGRGGLDEATIKRKRLIIGPSGATSLLDALTDVLAPGLVITADPMYYIYCNALERKGFQVLAVPEDAEGMNLESLELKLRELGSAAADISFFYIVTVNNPTCTILSNVRRRALTQIVARLAREQNRLIPIFFDLAYELLLHDPLAEPFASVMPADELGIVYEIGTLSKVLAPALRMGYLLGPDGPLIKAMIQKTSDVGFSAPLFVQEMAAHFLEHHAVTQLEAVNAGYREKALAIRQAIHETLEPLLSDCRGGRAGFYFYLTFKDLETDTQSAFFKDLTRTSGDPRRDGPPENRRPRVIYIPGEYCVHPRGALCQAGRRQLRLSYAFEDLPAIRQALTLMREAADRVNDE